MNRYAIPIVLLLFNCCTASFNSTESQCHYLQNLQDQFNEAFEESDKALRQFGYKSKEHNLALRKQTKVAKESLLKMEEYLRLHGFPTVEEHGPDFVEIPRKIIVDRAPDLETLESNLKYFYTSWQKGDLSDWSFLRFMQSMYNYKYGDILRLENPYTHEMQMDTLQKILNINDEILEAQNK